MKTYVLEIENKLIYFTKVIESKARNYTQEIS